MGVLDGCKVFSPSNWELPAATNRAGLKGGLIVLSEMLTRQEEGKERCPFNQVVQGNSIKVPGRDSEECREAQGR